MPRAAKKSTSSKPLAKPVEGPPTDSELIEACVVAGSALAAYHGAFTCDSDGNSKYAEKLARPNYVRKEKAVAKATMLAARSFDGLNAKARLAEVLIRDEDDLGSYMEPSTIAFISSLAGDVRRISEQAQATGLSPVASDNQASRAQGRRS